MVNSPLKYPLEREGYADVFERMWEGIKVDLGQRPQEFQKFIASFQLKALRLTNPEKYMAIKRKRFQGDEQPQGFDFKFLMPEVGSEDEKKSSFYLPLNLNEFFSNIEDKLASLEFSQVDEVESAPFQNSNSSSDADVLDETNQDIADEEDQEDIDFLRQFWKEVQGPKVFNLEEQENMKGLFLEFKRIVLELIEAGKVEEKVAVLFLGELVNLGFGSNPLYKAFVRSVEEEQLAILDLVGEIRGKMKTLLINLEKREDVTRIGGSYVIRFAENENKEKDTNYRLYINPRLAANPSELIDFLEQTIRKHGAETIDLKIVSDEHLRFRRDGIVIYFSLEGASKMALVIEDLLSNGMNHNIMEDSLPTGVEIIRGVSMIADPPLNSLSSLITFLRGEDTPFIGESANALYSNMFAMAFAWARDEIELDLDVPFNLEDLKGRALKYFKQLLLLSQINPETMMPMNINGGQVPPDLQALRVKYNSV